MRSDSTKIVVRGVGLTSTKGRNRVIVYTKDLCIIKYSVRQSDRSSSKTETFHEPTAYEPHVKTRSEGIMIFDRHEYGRIGVFKIKM